MVMVTREGWYFGVVAVSAMSFVTPGWSATVTALSGTPAGGTAIDLLASDFERIGSCGGGKSVVNDGCSVVIKNDPAAPHAYGRFDPPPQDYWIDSQDIDELKWIVNSPVSFSSLTFALTDAYDQDESRFVMSYNEAGTWTPIWEIAEKQKNGNLYWLKVDFATSVSTAEFLFSTKNAAGYDGYGISSLSVSPSLSPVPVPPSALLLLSGAMLMAGLRWRPAS
ncbi:hypothetical protein [uncultured Paracoccus sp.]|uniref:hypothetical protein n=1 Tax=Paracoccus sp. TaxID=267 RepID=UPI0026392FCB|nr:hypothetical protein [uncultured Paracoccus sp.]|tara:strand:+ start:296 stop:964 length:669 start_codon:yes stop_codon:yes gene_type:complete